MAEPISTTIAGTMAAIKTAYIISACATATAFIAGDAIWKARRDFGAMDYEISPDGVLFFNRDAISSTSTVVSLVNVYRLDIDALATMVREGIDAKRVGRVPTKESRAKAVAKAAKDALTVYNLKENAKKKALPAQAKPIGLIGYNG